TSHRAARAATKKAWIEIEKRLPLVTIEEALAAESYIDAGPITWAKGDVEAALAEAHKVIEGEIEIGGQEHFYLEGQAALAVPGEAGEVTVYSSTQHPTEIQHKVAEALGLPMHSVRIAVRRMGGAFGGKESQGNALAVACAIAAARTGRPCKMRYDRDDDMAITGKRHDFRIKYRAGITQAGKLTGVDFTHYVRAGWSADLT
ncbi:MAG: molybdopterin-dependent oxidoreductase, partial [Maritimibacter sp.]|nr:molybdopterin-dependent oxidoreductase [Maritimibacter sp.]